MILLGRLGLVIGAVVLVATHFQTVKDVVMSVWNALTGLVGFLGGALKSAAGAPLSVIVAAKELGPPISAKAVEEVRAKWGEEPAAAFARIAAEWRDAVDRGDAMATLRAERRTAGVLNVLLVACIQAVPEEVAL